VAQGVQLNEHLEAEGLIVFGKHKKRRLRLALRV
jgi:hypothetical protein